MIFSLSCSVCTFFLILITKGAGQSRASPRTPSTRGIKCQHHRRRVQYLFSVAKGLQAKVHVLSFFNFRAFRKSIQQFVPSGPALVFGPGTNGRGREVSVVIFSEPCCALQFMAVLGSLFGWFWSRFHNLALCKWAWSVPHCEGKQFSFPASFIHCITEPMKQKLILRKRNKINEQKNLYLFVLDSQYNEVHMEVCLLLYSFWVF